jgi:hypothetical protein
MLRLRTKQATKCWLELNWCGELTNQPKIMGGTQLMLRTNKPTNSKNSNWCWELTTQPNDMGYNLDGSGNWLRTDPVRPSVSIKKVSVLQFIWWQNCEPPLFRVLISAALINSPKKWKILWIYRRYVPTAPHISQHQLSSSQYFSVKWLILNLFSQGHWLFSFSILENQLSPPVGSGHIIFGWRFENITKSIIRIFCEKYKNMLYKT